LFKFYETGRHIYGLGTLLRAHQLPHFLSILELIWLIYGSLQGGCWKRPQALKHTHLTFNKNVFLNVKKGSIQGSICFKLVLGLLGLGPLSKVTQHVWVYIPLHIVERLDIPIP